MQTLRRAKNGYPKNLTDIVQKGRQGREEKMLVGLHNRLNEPN